MRWFHFLIIQVLLITFVIVIYSFHKERIAIVKLPPKSIADWYKPINKRQVWLHNMFKLRRELQAVEYYSKVDNPQMRDKWLNGFKEHYLKIAEMVPEWEGKIDLKALRNLEYSANNNQDLTAELKAIKSSCGNCHNDFRAITATLYRLPDFSKINIENSPLTFTKHMGKLITTINQIKIATEDKDKAVALSSLKELKSGMVILGEICTNCHEKNPQKYPSNKMEETMDSLAINIESGTLKEQGMDLGTLAVIACARCHSTHRVAYDTKERLLEQHSLKELIRH